MITRPATNWMLLGILGSATVLLAGSPGHAEPLDPVRCEGRQPKLEALLQVARKRCVIRAERREARGLEPDFQACEARAIAAYGSQMARAGCDVDDGHAPRPPRTQRQTATAWAVVQDEAVEVVYEVVGDYAVVHGDVILGRVDEVAAGDQEIRDRVALGEPAVPAPSPLQPRSHTRDDFGWSRAVIPFEIDGDLSNTMRDRITSAVAHWNANTIVRLQARNGEADFVRFVPGDGCLSHVGKKGGMQEIVLDTTCTTGNAIHEIGHAVGLYHEQNRHDRDNHVIVLFDNLEEGDSVRAQFEKGPFGSVDRDVFDFNSRMLYRPDAFSANDEPTMTRLDGSTWTPNLTVLSTGDIAGVTRMVTGLNGLFTAKDKFRNKAANRCMDADTGGQGAGVAVRDCTGATRQRWLLYTHPRTNRRLLINERSGMCLDVPGGSTTSGRDLIQFPCHGGTNQAFAFTDRTFTWDPWRIRNLASNLCVALESTANGGDVEQRTCGTSDQQKWFQELF